ncbi:hypothetical protein [Pseudonocardia sp. TRM90224]|uniref:hypothetical protein n=1 Tax=Pseudonocardia sp. TRM90224 TaxID=2812678 RepID=UPI001E3B786C|nr:hypothetical protein [Pseudonocardia sp. TRM90224]
MIPTDLGEIDEVIEGERILGQPVVGYRFISEGLNKDSNLGHTTFYLNAKKQLVRYDTKINGLLQRTDTYYDFGVPVDISPPPADQIRPS